MNAGGRPIGPNMRRFIVHRASLAVPPGGGLAAAVRAIANRLEHLKAATVWCLAAVDAVKAAPDNTLGTDDEAIAGEIVKRIDERLAKQAAERKR